MINEEDDYEYLFKIIIIGDSNCGKTKILQRYCNDVFVADSQATIGVEFISKIVEIDQNGETRKIRLQMWDTAGSEKYRSMTISHTRGAVGAIIVYDVDNQNSKNNVKGWFNLVKKANIYIPCIIVANKSEPGNFDEDDQLE